MNGTKKQSAMLLRTQHIILFRVFQPFGLVEDVLSGHQGW